MEEAPGAHLLPLPVKAWCFQQQISYTRSKLVDIVYQKIVYHINNTLFIGCYNQKKIKNLGLVVKLGNE